MSGGGRYVESDDYLKLAQGIGARAAVMKSFDSKQLLVAVDRALVAEPTRAWSGAGSRSAA